MDIATNSGRHAEAPIVRQAGIDQSILWVCGLCALPVLAALTTMQTDGNLATWQLVARQFWLPAQLFEIATILFALSRGCSPMTQMKSLTKPVGLLALTWMASVALATMFANDLPAAIMSSAKWMLHGLFAMSLWHLSRRWPADWPSQIVNMLPIGISAFAVVIIGFVMIVGVSSDYDWISSLPGFPHIRHPGYFLMPAIALSTLMVFKSTGRYRYLHACLLAVNFGFAIWIGSRGPLFVYALLLIPALFVFATVFAGNKTRAIGSVVLALLGGVLLSQAIPCPDNGAFNALSRFMGTQNTSVDAFSSGRTELWRETAAAIGEQPWIGHGGDQFRKQISAAKNTSKHPHDSILQFAYEWGVIGAVSFIALLAILFMRSFKATFADPEANLGMFFAASEMVLFSLIDGVFYYNLPIMLFIACMFGTLSQEKSHREAS